MKRTIKNLWEKFVIHNYVSAGLQWGNATSYLFIMGKAVGYDQMEKRLRFWEKQYQKLGYKLISDDMWVDAGGYGWDYESYLRVKV